MLTSPVKLEFVKPYAFAHDGIRVVQYDVGVVETRDSELVEMAVKDGVATLVEESQTEETEK